MSRKGKTENRFTFMGFLASMYFAVPTAILIFLLINITAIYIAPSGWALGLKGFVAILSVFVLVSLIAPTFFPSFLGYVWRQLLNWFRLWSGH